MANNKVVFVVDSHESQLKLANLIVMENVVYIILLFV